MERDLVVGKVGQDVVAKGVESQKATEKKKETKRRRKEEAEGRERERESEVLPDNILRQVRSSNTSASKRGLPDILEDASP